jgi:hypothetical protein
MKTTFYLSFLIRWLNILMSSLGSPGLKFEACVVLSGYQFMNGLTRVPRVGVHVFMTARVFWTIFEFFLSYLVELFGFAIVFHILLPEGRHPLLLLLDFWTYARTNVEQSARETAGHFATAASSVLSDIEKLSDYLSECPLDPPKGRPAKASST